MHTDPRPYRRRTSVFLLVAGLVLVAGCNPSGSPSLVAHLRTSAAPPVAVTTTYAHMPTRSHVADRRVEQAFPAFRSSVSSIDAGLRQRMRWSWRPGCPVPLKKLRYVKVSFVGFGGRARQGEMVVHRAVTSDVVDVMHRLYRHRFPIHRMHLVDDYRGDDGKSMSADNSSAFNCRKSTGSPGTWSQHSYGRAIDINPVENPYVSPSGQVQPREGARYADRSLHARGMIGPRSTVVRKFASIGWSWGGAWSSAKDYQHFSQNGR